MESASNGHEVGGGVTASRVDMREDWSKFLADLEANPPLPHAQRRLWTAEEDAFLIAARRNGATWEAICERIGCNPQTARKRLRLLEK